MWKIKPQKAIFISNFFFKVYSPLQWPTKFRPKGEINFCRFAGRQSRWWKFNFHAHFPFLTQSFFLEVCGGQKKAIWTKPFRLQVLLFSAFAPCDWICWPLGGILIPLVVFAIVRGKSADITFPISQEHTRMVFSMSFSTKRLILGVGISDIRF